MNPEKFDSKIYRSGLANSLKDLRGQGDEGKEKASQFLEIAKETSLYDVAEKEHRQQRDLEKEGQNDVSSQQESAELKEQRLVDILVDLVENHPSIVYQISANGNIKGTGSDIGQFGYRFDKSEKEFRKQIDFNDNSFPSPTFFDTGFGGDKSLDDLELNMPNIFFREHEAVIEYKLGVKFKKKKQNPFTSETRGNLTLSANLILKKDKNLQTLLQQNPELQSCSRRKTERAMNQGLCYGKYFKNVFGATYRDIGNML